MFKSVMLVSAFAISAPALAQTIPGAPVITDQQTSSSQEAPQQVTPVTEATAESTSAAAAAPAQDTAPATDAAAAAPAQTAPAAQATPPAQSAAAPAPADGAVTGKAQIAQVVAAEFPSYDKNSDGNLDKAEFAAWMVALKTASDPTTKATDPATQQWVGGAFASADTDKSSAVSQGELTTYLSLGAE